MALFLSTYVNKIDKKGRVSVPAPFRAVLANQAFSGVVVYGSFINPCIEGCGIERIERLSASIDALDPYSDERDAFATTILGGSAPLAFDSEGRIFLPESLITLAKLSEQAVFIGKGATFEIWEPVTFNHYAETARELARDKRASLRLQTSGGQS
jgi:MraZ protein